MRRIDSVKVGEIFTHNIKDTGTIIARTKRTLTAKFEKPTTKITYNISDSYFSYQDF